MFKNFFSRGPVPNNELVSKEHAEKPSMIDHDWHTHFFPDVLVLSADRANEAKNQLATIKNLFPEQYESLKQKAESNEISREEIAVELKKLADQLP